MRAVTGMPMKQFKSLCERFKINLDSHYRKERHIRPGLGRKGILKSPEEKLFYILLYFKVYPTFDMASILFSADRSSCCRWAHWYAKALEETLGKALVLPVRQADDLKKLLKAMPELKEVFIDGTDRPVRRPAEPSRQTNHYSGKKKRHSVKNIVVTTKKKRVIMLSKTVPGSVHDYTAFKDSKIGNALPGDIPSLMDTGFLGIQNDYPKLVVIMPKKKPKGKELTKKEKEKNKKISRRRIVVENSICGVKRLNIATTAFRNHKPTFIDDVMLIACGLWNYYLTF
jgi:hypothetical protein